MKSPIGKLDQQVTIQAQTATPDGIGGVTQGWATVETTWAAVKPVRASEAMVEGRMNAEAQMRFTLRACGYLTERHRLVWGGVPYNIRGIPMPMTRALYMDVIADRGVAS